MTPTSENSATLRCPRKLSCQILSFTATPSRRGCILTSGENTIRTRVHLFRGPGRVFGVTADPTGANLPTRFAPWTPFKTIELKRDESTPGLDVNECLDDLDRYGFHITDAHVRITESVL